MRIEEIRIYAEVLEQGIDFKEYINKISNYNIKNVYTKKGRDEIVDSDSLVTRIRKCKDVDVLIAAISDNREYPLLMVEYSTAVPTDDHKMQRSDVYYWSSVYRTPMMKIYPSTKGMNQSFGGGDKFTDEYEIAIANSKNAIFFPIKWETIKGTDTLRTKENALSCIYYSNEIKTILSLLLQNFSDSNTFENFYQSALKFYRTIYSDVISYYQNRDLRSFIVDSSRFKWESNKLISKINRFGHAMDPDRGVLYFANMLVGAENCITEIQVNRPADFNARGGYRSLFDAIARKNMLSNYVERIIKEHNNIFTPSDALYVFEHALNIENWHLFKKQSDKKYTIDDDKLLKFLVDNPSMTSKCIFFLSCKLILTDKNRNTICEISWNNKVIEQYLNKLFAANYTPIVLKELELADAKEDIITYASVELYKKIRCELAAVSYPGAQGDRCVLFGEGRTVKRTYIDIVAIKKSDNLISVFLEECKAEIRDSHADVLKLKDFIQNDKQLDGLVHLLHKTNGINSFNDIKISVGAKYNNDLPHLDVDYIFMFSLEPHNDKTIIDYSVAVIDTSLVEFFKPIMNSEKRLKGRIYLDKIFIIK